jgi:glutamine synthetase
MIETFRGKDLLQGEPDASSFPSGGLRATSAARGYTVWDPATPPFVLDDTLYLPSFFFSWKGEALDAKIPLVRSDRKIEEAVLRLLRLARVPAARVFSTLGPEQEYFTIDKEQLQLRPDLLLAGRAVYGAPPSKGQELEDHYFSAIDERVFRFMQEFEEAALLLGIPLKTRHNEVAPAQHESAPLFESASLASDHNLLLMRLMNGVASRHGLACLFHEKPFAKLNGSGKHCNWSLATDTGLNLLDPKEESAPFLILLTAVLRAVHHHSLLLRASIGSAANDCRLGGSEAPPTILSVYLGDVLEAVVLDLIHNRKRGPELKKAVDLGLSHVAAHRQDASDRNRTSFFAFTGDKFEFRAVGASQPAAWPITILNSIVAESLHLLLDEIEGNLKGQELLDAALPALQKALKAAQPVLFSGDNYSKEWELEAQKRGLPNVRKSFHAFAVLQDPKTERVFDGVLTPGELHARYEVAVERYAKQMNIECNLMVDLFRTHIYPALLRQQGQWAASLSELMKLK